MASGATHLHAVPGGDRIRRGVAGDTVGRVNRYTHQVRAIQPLAGPNEKLRFNWNTPLHLSPNEKGTLYMGAQFLYRTRDMGDTWERISPDLSTNDPAKLQQDKSGGLDLAPLVVFIIIIIAQRALANNAGFFYGM